MRDLSAQLTARGYSPEQALKISSYAQNQLGTQDPANLKHAALHKDGQSVALVFRDPPFKGIAIEEALNAQTQAQIHTAPAANAPSHGGRATGGGTAGARLRALSVQWPWVRDGRRAKRPAVWDCRSFCGRCDQELEPLKMQTRSGFLSLASWQMTANVALSRSSVPGAPGAHAGAQADQRAHRCRCATRGDRRDHAQVVGRSAPAQRAVHAPQAGLFDGRAFFDPLVGHGLEAHGDQAQRVGFSGAEQQANARAAHVGRLTRHGVVLQAIVGLGCAWATGCTLVICDAVSRLALAMIMALSSARAVPTSAAQQTAAISPLRNRWRCKAWRWARAALDGAVVKANMIGLQKTVERPACLAQKRCAVAAVVFFLYRQGSGKVAGFFCERAENTLPDGVVRVTPSRRPQRARVAGPPRPGLFGGCVLTSLPGAGGLNGYF